MGNTSLLEKLDEGQIDDLIAQIKSESEGYTYIYTIDADDILRHCFYYGINPDFSNINLEYDADLISAYHYLFSKYDKPIILFDQYLNEIINFYKTLQLKISKGTLVDFKQAFLNKIMSNPQFNKVDITILISLYSISNLSGIERFKGALNKEKLISSSEQLNNFKDKFSNVNISNLIIALDDSNETNSFNSLANKIKDFAFLKNLSFTFSKWADCQAIARTILTNQRLKHNKVRILYLSSNDFSNGIRDYGLLKEKSGLNYVQTIEQVFLKTILNHLESSEKIKELKLIKEIIPLRDEYRKLIISEKTAPRYIKDFYEGIIQSIYNKISYYRENFVNAGLLSEFKPELSEFIKENTNKSLEPGVIDKLKALLGSEIISNRENPLKNIIPFYVLALNIPSIKKFQDDGVLKIFRGNDNIKGFGHHMPLLFKSKNPLIEVICKIIISFPKKEQEDLNILKELLNTNLNNPTLESNFGIALFLMILPKNESLSIQGSEAAAYLLENILLDSNISQNLKSDIYYTLAFLYRRIKAFDKAKSHITNGKNDFKGDFRFIYAEVLLDYSKNYSSIAFYNDDLLSKVDLILTKLENQESNKFDADIRKCVMATFLASKLFFNIQYLRNEKFNITDREKALKLLMCNIIFHNLNNKYIAFLETDPTFYFVFSKFYILKYSVSRNNNDLEIALNYKNLSMQVLDKYTVELNYPMEEIELLINELNTEFQKINS